MPRHIALQEKLKEALVAVLPITLIVFLLCLFFVPVDSGLMLSFLVGALMLIVGMGLFSLGSDISMAQIGNHIGSRMTRSRRLWFILGVSLVLGVAITVAEPDLQVLAGNVPAIDTLVLIAAVALGVGFFLMLSMVRILFGIPLKCFLILFYGIVFVLTAASDPDFLAVAFDSGGVTTGPITVPFIIALGVGVASIRSDRKAKADSFGLVALCSIGPVLSVLVLGLLYPGSADAAAELLVRSFRDTVELGTGYLSSIPDYLKEVALALLPIGVFFGLFQVFALRLKRRSLEKIAAGLAYTYAGLVLFLTGANVGFSSMGYVLGGALAGETLRWLLVPLAMLMGWFIIKAEPAVHTLTRQVNELSAGAISEESMELTLSVGIAIAMGLSMVRVLTGISILWFLIPGYALALGFSFVVSPTFTAIAFDAGGVASGPLTATFMLPLAMGACQALGGNIMTDAFGLVAMVAMMPLITVQGMGFASVVKSRIRREEPAAAVEREDEIIELWEVA